MLTLDKVVALMTDAERARCRALCDELRAIRKAAAARYVPEPPAPPVGICNPAFWDRGHA